MNMLTPEDVAQLRAAIGRTMSRTELIAAEPIARFEVASGADGSSPLSHWAFFHEVVPDSQLGPDGHPRRGAFVPAIDLLPVRMFAASAMEFHRPLEVGASAEMTARIADVQHKRGKSGDLVFVEIERRINQQGSERLTERQTLVYRSGGGPVAESPRGNVIDGGECWLPTPVNLFRFSAATFNGHRIHYDQPYAVEVEGYPDLVVHGPFIAAKLAELAARRGALASFAFRAQAPCFVDRPIALSELELGVVQATRDDGVVAMTARVTYRA